MIMLMSAMAGIPSTEFGRTVSNCKAAMLAVLSNTDGVTWTVGGASCKIGTENSFSFRE